MTAAAWSVKVNSCFFCTDVLPSLRADDMRFSSALVLKDSSLDSRWRSVFAHHQAQAVGKARRPFIGFP